jgi:hypothetical protein
MLQNVTPTIFVNLHHKLFLVQGVSLAIGPKVFLITFKVIDVI